MKNVYTVAQVNGYIKNMFTQDFLLQSILVKGEVSNCKYHSSGHIYFTLKDGKGAIACVMFAGNRSGLKFHMQEGQQVVVGGTIDVFERDGRYQLYAKSITLDGAGQLYERFEQLKRELAEQGLFAPEYKQPIPRFIRTLGVVTAPTGAAVRDIINIATRRNPYVQIILYPAIVQGEQAPASIVNGIRALERCKVDVMNGADGCFFVTRFFTDFTTNGASCKRATMASACSLLEISVLSTFFPSTAANFAEKTFREAAAESFASIVQYSCGWNARISFSRSTTNRTATDCTLPADRPRRTFLQRNGLS